MEFCPKCGSVIMINKCARCDYTQEHAVKLESSQMIETKKEVVMVTEGEHEVHPIVSETCEKCQNPQSYFWTKQTRSGDEAETKFFKCTKCKHTWRKYR
jgi:DNA-directed RNA polymerase subunit M